MACIAVRSKAGAVNNFDVDSLASSIVDHVDGLACGPLELSLWSAVLGERSAGVSASWLLMVGEAGFTVEW